MTYTAFNKTRPDPAQNGPATSNDARTNLMALRDALVANGMVQGFAYSFTSGTADAPTVVLLTRTESSITEIIKVVITYDGNGNCSKAAYYYSTNGGSTYDPMADSLGSYVLHVTYDGSQNVTATSWDATP